MKTIKFRAWDRIGKLMIYQDNVCSCDYVVGIDKDGLFLTKEKYFGENKAWEVLEDAIFMQYTGIKDKNNNEIYEGDIVSTATDGENFVVIRRNGAFMYEYKDEYGLIYCDYMCEVTEKCIQDIYVKVIGNICENPELLI